MEHSVIGITNVQREYSMDCVTWLAPYWTRYRQTRPLTVEISTIPPTVSPATVGPG